MLATVRAHSFEDVLLCSSAPGESVSADGSSSSNLSSIQWTKKDQFLLSWLLSSISESMLGYVSRCAHSFQVWKVFEELFQSQSKARAMTLRFQLQTLKKGSMSIDEFILQMHTIADG